MAMTKVFVSPRLADINPLAYSLASGARSQCEANEYLVEFGLEAFGHDPDRAHQEARLRDPEEVREWTRGVDTPPVDRSVPPVAPLGVRHALRATFTTQEITPPKLCRKPPRKSYLPVQPEACVKV